MNILDHLNIPSPITKIETSWSKESQVSISLKRDDLIHPLISGNKWRKLSGILSHYKAESYDEIVTYGGSFSNHLVATAVVCSILGKSSVGIIRGEEPKEINGTLKLCNTYGMKLQYVTRPEYKETNRTLGVIDRKLVIPEGGACDLGTAGCQQILAECDLTTYDHILVSCGTGTTIAGMAQYLQSKSIGASILKGVQVLKGEGYISNELQDLYGIQNVTILDQFHCGGYAKTNKELITFIRDFATDTGVLLDPIYTGKMMFAIQKKVNEGTISKGEKVLAVHTGGLTGWFGKHKEL